MSIWNVSDPQTVSVKSWSVIEAYDGYKTSRHIVGYNVDEKEGRVSSDIVESKDGKLITRSGRIYNLIGDPGYDSDGSYVWENWKRLNKIKYTVDVTKEYIKD